MGLGRTSPCSHPHPEVPQLDWVVSRGQSHPRATPHSPPDPCLHRRLLDHSNEGFSNWEFMSVHCWGEKAEGVWTLEIQDMPAQVRNPDKQGQWSGWLRCVWSLSFSPFS